MEIKNLMIKELMSTDLSMAEIESLSENIEENFKTYLIDFISEQMERPTSRGKLAAKYALAGLLGGMVGMAAYVIFRAAKAKYFECKKACKGSKEPSCMYKCRVQLLRAEIAALEKQKEELRKNNKLTETREKRIDEAINKIKERIGDMQQKYHRED